MVPGQTPQVFEKPSKQDPAKTASHPSRAKWPFCPRVSLHFHVLLLSSFSFKCPRVPLGNVFIWDLRPDLSVVVERFPQKLCCRGLHHLWERVQMFMYKYRIYVISKLPREKFQFPGHQKVKILIDSMTTILQKSGNKLVKVKF